MQLQDIKAGTRLEIVQFDQNGDQVDPSLVSGLEWAPDNETVVIAAPIYKGVLYALHVDTEVLIRFIAGDAVYYFKGRVKERSTLGNLNLLTVVKEGEIKKVQRREFFRFYCTQPVLYREHVSRKVDAKGVQKVDDEEGYEKTVSKNLSGGGACFISREKMELGMLLDIKICLHENKWMRCVGKIVRAERMEGEGAPRYEIGVHFIKMREIERQMIVKFIFKEQRRLREKGLI